MKKEFFTLKNILSGTDRKNQGELPTLVGALTLEAQPIAFGVGGWFTYLNTTLTGKLPLAEVSVHLTAASGFLLCGGFVIGG